MSKSHDDINLYDIVTYAGYKWFVIKKDHDKVTLLAKNDDFGELRFDKKSSNYQNSEIRRYINSVLVEILTKNGAELEKASLQDLDDKVFLLSKEEVEELPINIRRFTDWWWLRSSAYHNYHATYVYSNGGIKSFEPESIVDKAIRIAEDIASEVNSDPFLQSEPSFSKEVECTVENWVFRDEEESAIEDDWIARRLRIQDIFQSHGMIFKGIYPEFRRLAGCDTMTELVSSCLVFSHKVGSGVITAKVVKDIKVI